MSSRFLFFIILIIGGLMIYLVGIKSAVKVRYKVLFIILGGILAVIGAYGVFTSFISNASM